MLPVRAALPRLAALAILAWTAGTLGLTLPVAASAGVLLALAILPWGLLLTHGLAVAALSSGERWVLCALVGYPVSAALYYLLSRAEAAGIFLPLSGLLALALAARTRSRSPGATGPAQAALDPRARAHWSLPVFGALSLLVMTRFSRAFVATEDGLAYRHSVDHSLHLSFYWELLRGVPPAQIPAAAGLPFPAYHWLAFMPGLLLIRAGDLPITTVYHALSPLLKVTLLMGALYLAARIRSGDARVATAVLPLAFLAGYAFERHFDERFVVGPAPHYDLLRNEAEGGGLVVWGAIACLLLLHDRSPGVASDRRRSLLLAGLLAGLSYGFKAQLFLLFGGALVLALLPSLALRRSPLALQALLAMSGAFAILFLLSRGPGSIATLQWRPGLFAELYIYPNLRRDPWPLVKGPLLAALQSVPGGRGYLPAVPLAIFRIVAFSPLVVGFLFLAVRRAARLGLADRAALLAFLLALPMGYGLSVVSFYRATSPFEFRQAAHGLAFLGVLIDVLAAAALLRLRGREPGALVLGGSALLAALAAPALAREVPYVPARAAILLPPDEQCALLFLRRRTPPDAVVISARPGPARLNHQAVVAGIAGRRSVLEFYQRDVDWNADRERDVRRLFATADQEVAARILQRYSVDYVLEEASSPLRFAKTGLELSHANGGFKVYRVKARPGGATSPPVPEPFARQDELRCAGSP